MPNSHVQANADGLSKSSPCPGLLHDKTPSLLMHIYSALPEHDRAEFQQMARAEFGNGLSSTTEGARRALRHMIAKPASWVSPALHQRRVRFLATIDDFMARVEGAQELAA